jgi:hypothetical protein
VDSLNALRGWTAFVAPFRGRVELGSRLPPELPRVPPPRHDYHCQDRKAVSYGSSVAECVATPMTIGRVRQSFRSRMLRPSGDHDQPSQYLTPAGSAQADANGARVLVATSGRPAETPMRCEAALTLFG